jgi:folate-binding protein YgfZ
MIVPQGYDAARARAAFLPRPGRGKIAVAGADRKSYLHAMLTNDIATLEAGAGCYAAYLTPQGRMITDLRVFEVGDLLLLELAGEQAGGLLQKLDAFVFTEDVKLGDLTLAFDEVRLVGPDAPQVAARVLGGQEAATRLSAEELAAWPEYRNARAAFQGAMVLLAASHELGLPGFDFFIEPADTGRLLQALAEAGAESLSEEAAEALRIEAGLPLFGADLDTTTIPLEAGIEDRAISFTKGCYPGQEVIVRVVHRGHGRVARRLVGLTVPGDVLPSSGDTLRAGDREAGRVTSVAWSPSLGVPVALAYVGRDFAEPGTLVHVDHGGAPLPATVARLPFIAPAGGPS